MRLFGGVLPFIGFREEALDDDLRSFFGLPESTMTINTFQIGWFGVAVAIPIKPSEDD